MKAALQGLKGRDNHSGWHDCLLMELVVSDSRQREA